MKVLRDGHRYELSHLDGSGKTVLEFVNREPGEEVEGPTTQEVIRALIDRTFYCDHCLPCHLNAQAVYHLRMALVLHEARHLIRVVEKGDLRPEMLATDADGHFAYRTDAAANLDKNAKPYLAEPRDYETTNTGGPRPGTPCYLQAVK